MKKKALISLLLVISINILVISAIELDISERPISNAYITELKEPATYELKIQNLEESDSFQIYSLVGIDISPKSFELQSGEIKNIPIELNPQKILRKHRDTPYRFEYKIKNSKNQIQQDTLSIKIIDLEYAFSVETKNIDPDSKKVILEIRNNLFNNFPELELKITSAFFEHEETISLSSNEEKQIEILIDMDKLKTLDAGNYLMNTQVTTRGGTSYIESQIQFLEQEGIETKKTEEGFFIKRTEFIRKNIGNTKKPVKITTGKNIFSSIFTSINIPPTETKMQELDKIYIWEKELIPNEELKIIIKTNWFIPIIVILLILIIIYLSRKSKYSNLDLTKRVSFIKTKGGQFALKVSLKVKAKNHLEKIKLIDKIPPLVKLYSRFGATEPDKIDPHNRRLEWNIESLNKDETRIFSYIIYSKIGVVGRFELPYARATYERNGKINETESNRSFYINEPRE
jgi:hypothetical protein